MRRSRSKIKDNRSMIKNLRKRMMGLWPKKGKLKVRKKSPSKKFKKINFFSSLKPRIPVRQIAGIIFVVFGIIFLFVLPVPREVSRASEPITASINFKDNKEASQIVRILIPKVDIDLEVKTAKLNKGVWETSENSASHGAGSANPGEKNNVVVFAHARENLFYNLKDVKKDDIIYIFTKDKWHKYKVSEIKSVYPKQVETVAPTNQEVLTLFTCSGFFDEKRLIIKALPAN